jgi:hypothetical protein
MTTITKSFEEFLIEKLSTWDKVKKRYRQGSVKSRIAKHYDRATKKRDNARATYKSVDNLKSVDRPVKDYFWKNYRKASDQAYEFGDVKFASSKKRKIQAMTRYFDTYAAGKLGMKKPLVRKK